MAHTYLTELNPPSPNTLDDMLYEFFTAALPDLGVISLKVSPSYNKPSIKERESPKGRENEGFFILICGETVKRG